jgi:hypothetical protein
MAQYQTLPNGDLDTFWLAQNESVYVWLGSLYNSGQLVYWEPQPLYTGGVEVVPFDGPLLQCTWLPTTAYTSEDATNSRTLITFVRLVTNNSTVTDAQGGATFCYFYANL